MATVKGTWRFNDVLTFPTGKIEEKVRFANALAIESLGQNLTRFNILVYTDSFNDRYDIIAISINYENDSAEAMTVFATTEGGWYDEEFKTITFTEEQEVSDEFYEWFTANATRIDEEKTPIATITYKGETLETLNGGEYVTLHTKGQMMEDDIRVDVAEGSGGGDIAINGIIEQYKVNAGATVNAGDFVEFVNRYGGGTFDTIGISSVSACKLGDSVLVAYHNGGYVVNAVVLSFNGVNIEAGQKFTVTEPTGGSVRSVSVSALTDNKAIMACNLPIDGKHTVCVKVLEIDGATITAGEINQVGAGSYQSVTVLTESKAVLVYSSDTAYATVLNIDETAITCYSKKLSDIRSNYRHISVTKLSENTVLMSAENSLCVLSISGNSISSGNAYYIVTSNYPAIVVGLSANKAAFCYTDSSGYGVVATFSIDGIALSMGQSYRFTSNGNIYTVCALSENKVLLLYTGESDKYGKAIVVTFSDTITANNFSALDYNDITCASVVAFSPTSALVTYGNGTGVFASLSIDGDTITADSAEIGTYVQPATSRLHNVGVAKTSGTEGQMVDVYCV